MWHRLRVSISVLFIGALVFSTPVRASSCTTIFAVETKLAPANSAFTEEYLNIVEGFVSSLRTINVEVITVATYRSPTSSELDDVRHERIVAIRQHLISFGFPQEKIFASIEDIRNNSLVQEGVVYLEALGLNRKCLENPLPRP